MTQANKLPDTTDAPIEKLLWVMRRLRDPNGGCPWDREQNFATIAPYTVEEAYEVADAIARQDWDDLRQELGDLLLQVVFHAQMAEEQGLFQFDDVAHAIVDKLVYRHPHVFGDATAHTAEDVIPLWNARKEAEKKKKQKSDAPESQGFGLPALMRAQKIHRKRKQVQDGSLRVSEAIPNLPALAERIRTIANVPDANTQDMLVDMLWIITRYAEDNAVDLETALATANPG